MTLRYGQLLAHALGHRVKVLVGAGLLLAGSILLTPLLGSNFLTRVDDGQFSVWADVDPGMSVEAAGKLAERMSGVIGSAPEVTKVYSIADNDMIKIFVKLVDKRARSRSADEITRDLRQQLNAIPGVKVSMVQNSGAGEGKPVELVVRGDSLEVLEDLADNVHRLMETIPGAVDVTSSHRPGKPDIQVSIRREQAADLGISTGVVADTLRTLFNGLTVSQFRDGDDRYDVVVRLAPDDRRGMEDLTGIYLPARYKDEQGRTVLAPLSQVAGAVYATSPGEIRRFDRQKMIRLTANLDGTSLGEFNRALAGGLEKIPAPSGYGFAAIGESERMGDTFASMALALFLSVVFIFFVLAAQFESYVDPFAIMFSLPLALIGAIGGLLLMRSSLSITSMIGIIMLMGLVTKNAILLVDFAKQRRAEGAERNDALLEAARVRMRPIMMTTAAMIFGMLPLAFGIGPGAEGRAPMAHAIIGGLLTSTVLTLVVVPVVYSLLDDARMRLSNWTRRPLWSQAGRKM